MERLLKNNGGMVDRLIAPVLKTEFLPAQNFVLSEHSIQSARQRMEANPKMATIWQQKMV